MEAQLVIASHFIPAVAPWDWEEMPDYWFNWTMTVRAGLGRAQNIANRPKDSRGNKDFL